MDLLQNIKVVDFTRLLPGPVATHLLAQMGAKVLKIESPKRMDYARGMGMQVDGASILFHQLNHNKEIMQVDYELATEKKRLLEKIKNADALIEQFRPGAMDAWGLGYETLRNINPGIVYVSLTGYGQDGPYRREAGHDFNYLANAGMMSLLKDDKGKPVVPGFQIADIAGGAYMIVMALQAALLKKAYTGEGAFVDVAMCDGVMPLLAVPYGIYKGGMDHRQFNILNGKNTVNYAAYECADSKWLSVGAVEMKFWNRICELIEKPEWQTDNPLNLLTSRFPKAELEAIFKTKTRDEWMREVFLGEDVCIAPILEIEELEASDYHNATNSFEEFETTGGTKLKTIGLPFRVKK